MPVRIKPAKMFVIGDGDFYSYLTAIIALVSWLCFDEFHKVVLTHGNAPCRGAHLAQMVYKTILPA